MSDESSSPANEEALREYVDFVCALKGALTPTQEQALHQALDKLPGVKSVSVAQKTLAVTYDPTETAQGKITGAIGNAGIQFAEPEVTPSSPMTDALSEQHAPTQEPSDED